MENDLMKAALTGGDIDLLYKLIELVPNVLDEIDKEEFVQTPLHVAASEGKTVFASEIMELKPSFAHKWNKDRFTPLHLAVQCKRKETALRLANINADVVRVKGKGKLTPLHCAAEQGNMELLLGFLSVCPKSIEDLTIRNETCFHLALKNNKLEAFEVLVGWMELGCEEGPYWQKRILNQKDDENNTILQLARDSPNFVEAVSVLANSRLLELDNVQPALAPAQDSKLLISFLDGYTHLLRIDQRLNKAAYDGGTKELYAILEEDQYILDRIDQVPFVDTPLHIAASVGNTTFAREIMLLKPSLATKLNQNGFSPMHLAFENKETETVRKLVGMNKELVSVKGKGGMTPLHRATEVGDVELLNDFLKARRKSLEDLTVNKESALHVAVKRNQLASLKAICKWIKKKDPSWPILGWIDDEGKTARDIAETDQRIDREIGQFLKKLGAPLKRRERDSFFDKFPSLALTVTFPEEINMLMVVFTLIASTTYQAAITPPGGDKLYSQMIVSLSNVHSSNDDSATYFMFRTWGLFLVLNTLVFMFSVGILIPLFPRRLSVASIMLSMWILSYFVILICGFTQNDDTSSRTEGAMPPTNIYE